MTQEDASSKSDGFPIVGIGASAGGLEALEELIGSMGAEMGLAFVVVTHLRPGHTSLLPELLSRVSRMPVVQITDGVKLEPNQIYVAPPGEHLSALGGTLQLIEVDGERSPRLPIDHFFRSLADDQRQRAIGIVLSGTGSDGSTGVRAIKAESGMVIVQKPQSAKFSGMPSSAIATGVADYVLPPAEMAGQLATYTRAPRWHDVVASSETTSLAAEPLHKTFLLLRSRTGIDFTSYKPSTIRRRISRRMNVHQIEDLSEYVHFLQENPHEIDLLFKELLISVTSFFRDPEAWEALASGPLPELLKSRPEGQTLRAWIPACASGEEVYSLAILLRESAETLDRPVDFQLFGTDLDRAAIEVARSGRYPDGVAADLSPGRLEGYFVRDDGGYRVRQEIREMVVFAPQNVIGDPPFTKLDILCCRNLLIYLNAELQRRLLPLFHYSLKPDGLLFLGTSETIGNFGELFEPVDKKWKIFRRKATATNHRVEIPVATADDATESDTHHDPLSEVEEESFWRSHSVERLIEQLILSRCCPAAIVINERAEIVHVQGRTGAYFEPAAGQPRMNALDMAREGLQVELATAIRRAVAEDREVSSENIRVKTNGEYTLLDLTVTRIADPEPIRGLLLATFRPSAAPPTTGETTTSAPQAQRTSEQAQGTSGRAVQLEREIEYLKWSQRTTREKLERSNEELKATNEELQSTNEELQSSNEELETSKEETQSLNEELNTVNTELQSKVESLSHANDDMQNLLNSIEVATIFLDNDLTINRYTDAARDLIMLREADIGRPIRELATNLRESDLAAQCQEVLRTLTPRQQEVSSKDGVWYMLRILPYRTKRNVIEGVVITLVNIDELKSAKQAAERRAYFENLFETVRHPLVVLDERLHVVSANRRFYHAFGADRQQVLGSLFYEIGGGQWDIPELRELLEQVLTRDMKLEDFEITVESRSVGRQRFVLSGRRVEQEAGHPGLILLAIEECT